MDTAADTTCGTFHNFRWAKSPSGSILLFAMFESKAGRDFTLAIRRVQCVTGPFRSAPL